MSLASYVNTVFVVRWFIILIVTFMNLSVITNAQDTFARNSLLQKLSEGETDSIKADAAISIAGSYEELNIDSAMHYLETAATLMDTAQINILSAKYFLMISKIMRIDGKTAEALYFGQKAIEKNANNHDPTLYGFISIAIAEAYHRSTDYESALNYGLEGAKIGESIVDSTLIAASLNIRGNIMRETNRLDEARSLFQKHYKILMALGQEEATARSLTNIGITHAIQKDHSKAYPYYRRAIGIAKKYDNDYLIAFPAGSMGQTFSEENKVDSAIFYLNLAIEGFSNTNNVFGELFTINQLGSLHNKNENYNLTLKTLLPAYERSKELSTTNLTDGLVRGISTAYENLGNYKLAYEYQQIHIALKDTMINEQVVNAVNNAEAKYKNEKKQLEIERLSLQDELNNVRINRQRLALGGLVVGIGSLAFLLFRLFGKNKEIIIRNKIISKANNEKEVLLKEIHHRVKNNLQVISSLLGIQSREVTDLKAKEAIQEGRRRVHSMSLIHQNLYKKDNLTGIEMIDYMKKLGTSINSSYSLQPGQVALQYDIDDITLDVESVVPIGLITNELLTNSLKYAFPDERKGIIKINLKKQVDHLLLSIADDGIGLNINQLHLKKESFGHSLIRAFRKKLDATIEINGDNGTEVIIKIRSYKMFS